MHATLSERSALCDLFDQLGPDAPTRCDGWTTRELAAHLWTREHRPDAGPGLLGRGPFAGWTERLEARTARRPYAEVVAELRAGPPPWWFGHWIPAADLHEWFVHHEDVRRANELPPRDDATLDDAAWSALGPWSRILTRRAAVGVQLSTPGGTTRTAKSGRPVATVTGRPSELMLRLFGRDANVAVSGSSEAIAGFEQSDIGL